MSEILRTILITGSTDGIGRQTAVILAKNAENHIIIHGRNQERCDKAIKFIREKVEKGGGDKCAQLSSVTGDFSRMSDIPKMAAEVKGKFPKLNVLLCNAGVYIPKRQISQDGLELAFQVNHLAHFALANQLLSLLKSNQPSRVILVSSICHDWRPMAWEDMQSEAQYESVSQYSRTKLMNHMFAFALHRRLAGSKVTCNVLEPGVVETKMRTAAGYSGSPVEGSGGVSAFLAQSPDVEGVSGEYFSRECKKIQANEESRDKDSQEKLWKLSEELCKKSGVEI